MRRTTVRILKELQALASWQATGTRAFTLKQHQHAPHSQLTNTTTHSRGRLYTTQRRNQSSCSCLSATTFAAPKTTVKYQPLLGQTCRAFTTSGIRRQERGDGSKDKDTASDSPKSTRSGSTSSVRLTSDLPTRVRMVLDTPGVFPKDLAPDTGKEPSREIRQSFGTTYGGNYKLQWEEGPRTVLIIKKPNDELTDKAVVEVASWIHTKYPHMNVVVEPDVAQEFWKQLPFVYTIPENEQSEYARVTDLAVTLGGDGTILHTSSLFQSAVPPVISFSMGTLGFLLPFHINNYQAALEKLIETQQASLLLRMRLKCTLHGADGRRLQAKDGSGHINDLTVMNEVNLHRGRYPHLTWIGCYVDGHLITEAVADGLIVASPTGSTAYSLSAGGSIVHPSIQSLLLTPICPRSLSFRPVLLPPNATIQLKIGEKSRGPAEVSMDGKETFFLDKNEFLQVCMSAFPMPCVNRVHAGEDWIKDINDLLKWNQGFLNKQSMSHYMSD
ncbi:MAG: ATP-NAD kinase-like domain-containing protein [Benniella sp.]|nr:MAG: ATP-NAD kinase-like domain-containing protein [Benniella sp.]